MNKTKIDWADSTWNPVTGCLNDCPYCYAKKISTRFDAHFFADKPKVLKFPMRSNQGIIYPYPYGFTPTFHRYRLDEPAQKKKPQNIFVCSMADLFGDWVPISWIKDVLTACYKAPWHNYLFLTKNPQRLIDMGKQGLLPAKENYWYGTTITDDATPFFYSEAHNCFLSIEPLMGAFGEDGKLPPAIKWVIIGAETGNRKGKVTPQKEWIESIVDVCRDFGTPVFMTESLRELMGDDSKQEFPEGLKR